MNSESSSPTPRRVIWLVSLALSTVVLCGFGFLYYLRISSPPSPPDIDPEGIDPDVYSAIEVARRKVQDDPNSADAWAFLGRVLIANGRGREAVTCLHQAEKLDGKEPRWPYYLGILYAYPDPQAAIACFRRSIDCGDPSDSDFLPPRLELATLLLQEGRDEEARAILKTIHAKAPQNPRKIYLEALLLANRNDPRGSAIQLHELTGHPTTRRKASARLAQLYLRLGEASTAAHWDDVAQSLPEDASWPDPYMDELVKFKVGRGQRFAEVGRLERERRYAEAVALLQEMTADKERTVGRAYADLGNNLVHLGRGPEAEEAYLEALRLAPDDAETYHRLALVRLFQGEVCENRFGDKEGARKHYVRALESARAAVRISPRLAAARATLGQIQLALGQREAGIAALEESLASRPDSSNAHLVLGNALAQDGRLEEARRHLRDAVRFADKNDPRPKEALERFEAKTKSRMKAKPAGP
jgi:tetratricopeptide (TPR) repeat protein